MLLDNYFNVKLSDFGLAKLELVGAFGYRAPEYAMSGKLTIESDIYRLGVVLLELITGSKAIELQQEARRAKSDCIVTTIYEGSEEVRRNGGPSRLYSKEDYQSGACTMPLQSLQCASRNKQVSAPLSATLSWHWGN